ncbi:MAG: DNA polymerase III subunit epsilon [Thermomicrobiales bacterium]|nr:MAG: DNA polymerase III subunit epsilon [Thermomicrobiales bacterium]
MSDQFAALDIEATGMDPARHDIIEVAVVVFSREREVDRFSSLIRPRGRLSLDMAGLTGIDPRELRSAPSIDQVAPIIRRMTAGRPIVGHSVELDVAMLGAAGVNLTGAVYDTHLLATLLLPDLPNYSLQTVATALGITIADGHRALEDALAAVEVFRALLARIDALDSTLLERVATLGRSAGWSVADLFLAAARQKPAGPLFAQHEADQQPTLEMKFLVPRDKPEPLRRTGSKAPVDERSVAAILAPGGAFSQVLPFYEHRPAQETMARAVTRAFNGDHHLLVEAGTGTGKSVAYLLPAVLHARERGETVVVSTNTLALQDQLFRKDIPDLQRALSQAGGSVPFEAAILKGRQNYLCLRRWFAAQRQPVTSPEEAGLRAKILLWLGSTTTGDRAELRLSAEEEAAFRHVSAEGEACVPAKCVFNQRNQCFLFRARRQAEHAHVVVVNHALLLSDTLEGGTVLPDYERLIVDEAHHLEDQATTQFGFSVSEHAILEILDIIVKPEGPTLGGLIQSAINELARQATDAESRNRVATALERGRQLLGHVTQAKMAANDLFLRLRDLVDQERMGAAAYERSVRLTPAVRRRGEWIEVEIAWERLDREMTTIEGDLTWFLETLERVIPGQPDAPETVLDLTEDVVLEITNALRALADVRVQLAESVIDPSAQAVYWVEREMSRGGVSLRSAPLSVGPLLRDRVFAPLRTAILTSATLTTDGSFDYIRERVGLEDAEEMSVPSPFDYERSTLLYLVDDIPEPSAPR